MIDSYTWYFISFYFRNLPDAVLIIPVMSCNPLQNYNVPPSTNEKCSIQGETIFLAVIIGLCPILMWFTCDLVLSCYSWHCMNVRMNVKGVECLLRGVWLVIFIFIEFYREHFKMMHPYLLHVTWHDFFNNIFTTFVFILKKTTVASNRLYIFIHNYLWPL